MAAAASESGSHQTSLQRRCRVLFSAIALWFVGHLQICEAVLMHTGANEADHITLGIANNAHVLWVQSEYQGTKFYFSAIRINDYYAITAGHAVYSATVGVVTPTLLGDGDNRLNSAGEVRTIAAVTVYPTYQGASTLFRDPDIAILRFSHLLPGSSPTWAPASSLAVGQVVTSTGFGVPGFTDTGFRTEDGQLRGWKALIAREIGGQFNPTFYGETDFYPNAPTNLNGRYSNGDSGSPVYDVQGRLMGMTVGGTPETYNDDPIGSTIFLDFTDPTIRAWIEANTKIPEPPEVTITVTSTAAELTFTNLEINREYRVMRSSTLNAWEEAHRFTATSTTGSWSEALSPEGMRFYRLEWTE